MNDICVDELLNKNELTLGRSKQLTEKYETILQIMFSNEMRWSFNLMKVKISIRNKFLALPS